MAYIESRTKDDGATSWRVAWRENGKRKSRTFTTEREAKRFRGLVDFHRQRDPETVSERDGKNIRVGEWAARSLANRDGVSAYMAGRYDVMWEQWVEPQLGDLYLSDVTRETALGFASHIATTESERTGRLLTRKSQKNILSLASSVFTDAMENHLIDYNPFAKVQPTKSKQSHTDDPRQFLTVDEFYLIADHMEPGDPRELVELMAGTGARFGEATALDMARLDTGKSQIRIERAWKPDGTLGPPKTASSIRNVTLDQPLLERLKRHAKGKGRKDFLFTVGGEPIVNYQFRRWFWEPAVRAAQADGLTKTPRLHDLRHSHVAWLIAAGVPMFAIQKRLGHSSYKTTADVYGHLVPEVDDGVTAALEAMKRPGALRAVN